VSRCKLLVIGAALTVSAHSLGAQAPGSTTPPPGYWTGIVHWRVSHEAGIGQSTRHVSGSVAMAPSRKRPGEVQVSIKLLASDYIGAEFQWTLARGRCFAGGEPLIPPATLPDLPITNDGVAELDVDSPFVLAADGAYHFNLYLYGVQETNVVACAELKPARAR
jgi:hypothetical protein